MRRGLIAILALGLLSACAGVMTPAARSENPKQSLQSAGAAMAKAKTVRFIAAGTITITLPQQVVAQLQAKAGSQSTLLGSATTVTFKATGSAQRPDQLDANLSATIGGLTISTEVIATGGHVYYKDPMTQKWELAKRPAGGAASKPGSSLYQGVLDTARSLTEVSPQPSKIDGATVEEYRIVPDLANLFAQIESTRMPQNPQALAAIRQVLQSAAVTANVWTGSSDHLLRRVTYDADVSADLSQLASAFASQGGSESRAFTIPAGSTGRLTAHVEVNLHDYNRTVTISAPTIGS
jgi:hypothetical protein